MKHKLHIVTSGCSFTNNFRPNVDPHTKTEDVWKKDEKDIYTWFHWLWKSLGKETDTEFYNYGAITNDNKTICRSIFYKVNDLIFNKGVNPKDIIVIAQWTSLTRNSWFISNEIYKENNCHKNYLKNFDSPPHTNDFLQWDYKKSAYENGYYYLTGGYYSPTNNPDGMQEFAIEYLNKVLSKDERYIDWFDSMIGLFSYLESLGVTKIKSFQMNNNFSKSYLDDTKTPPIYDEERKIKSLLGKKLDTYDCIIKEKIICNTWNDVNLNDQNPYVKMYSDRIDFDKYFWFFEENYLHKQGGIIEWSIRNFKETLDDGKYNLPKVLWREMNGMDIDDQRKYLNTSWYGHTSSILARKFVNDVVLNWDILK
jgi:hypothetical protein